MAEFEIPDFMRTSKPAAFGLFETHRNAQLITR